MTQPGTNSTIIASAPARLRTDDNRLKYIYLKEMPDGPTDYGTGALIHMDNHDPEFVRDPKGRWGPERWLWLEGDGDEIEPGCFDLCWPHRTILDLIRKGWVEVVGWDERMAPTRVRRSSKPGIVVDG